MTDRKWPSLKIAVAVALGASTIVVAQPIVAQEKAALSKEEAEGIIFERQQIMEQLTGQAETLGNIVAGLDKKSSIVEVTKEIAVLAKEARTSFEHKVPGGRAKPEVWSDYDAYKKRMDDWVAASENMAKVAETGTKEAVISVMGDALPCKQCHDVYREPPKPKA